MCLVVVWLFLHHVLVILQMQLMHVGLQQPGKQVWADKVVLCVGYGDPSLQFWLNRTEE